MILNGEPLCFSQALSRVLCYRYEVDLHYLRKKKRISVYLESVANRVLLKCELRFCRCDGTPLLKRDFLPGASSTCDVCLVPIPSVTSSASTLRSFCSSYNGLPAVPHTFPRHLLPQRFCKCFSLCLEYFFPQISLYFVLLWVSAWMSQFCKAFWPLCLRL